MNNDGLVEVRAFVTLRVRDQVELHRAHEQKRLGAKVDFRETAGRLLEKSLRVIFAS